MGLFSRGGGGGGGGAYYRDFTVLVPTRIDVYRCHFNNKCCNSQNQVQLIEYGISDDKLEVVLWHHEKYWKTQLLTNTMGIDT